MIEADLAELFAARRARDGYLRAAWRYWLDVASITIRPLMWRRSEDEPAALGDPGMLTMLHDIRRAIRSLVQQRTFAVTTVLVLGIAVAITTVTLSVLSVYLLRPLPVPAADRLMAIVTPLPSEARPPAGLGTLDWQRSLGGFFERVVMWDLDAFTVLGEPHPEVLLGAWVSSDYFVAGGVTPLLGRTLLPEDSRSGAGRVAMISHRAWQSRFNGDPTIVGRPITSYAADRPLEANIFTIVGVLPPEFWFFASRSADLLAALPDGPRMPVFVRLREGVQVADAEGAIAAAVASLSPADSRWRVRLEPAAERHVFEIRPTLIAAAAAVALVMLIAVSNVAILLLLRALDREREVSIRLALGAGRGRLARELLTEAMVLSVAGCALGLGLTALLLEALAPAIQQSLRTEIPGGPHALQIDWIVATCVAAAALIIGAVLGLVPLIATRSAANNPDAQGGRTTTMTAQRRRLRSALVGVELAISLALVVGAGLTIQSALHLNRLALGFTPDLLKTEAMLSIRTYPRPSDRAAIVERLVTSAAGVAGIESATAVWPFPFRNAGTSRWEASSAIGMTIDATEYTIGDRYFETLRVPLMTGRLFTRLDTLTAPRVAIVSDTFARRTWPDRSAVGERIRRPAAAQQPAPDWITVVGVAGETRQTLTETDPPELYLPYSQRPIAATALLVRTPGNSLTVLPSLRAAVNAVDPELALFGVEPLTELVAASTTTQRFLAWLLGALAAFASLLAVVGVYGVIAFGLARRQRDIAMRLCLGARRDAIVALLLRQEGAMVAAGLLGGLGLAFALTRSLASELHGIQASDVMTFAGASIGLALVAAIAIVIPAVRTSRLDIMTVFRRE